MNETKAKHIILTSHPQKGQGKPLKIKWGSKTPIERGPIVASMNDIQERNVIGTHSGGYGLYRALAVAAGTLDPVHKPDLTDTAPTNKIGPFDQWNPSIPQIAQRAPPSQQPSSIPRIPV